MAGKKAYLASLSKVSLFSSCSNKDLEKIAKAGDEVTVEAGATIVDQGQTGREAFVLLKGSATVRRNGKKVATLGPGSVVGELSLLDHGPRTASVVADTDCTMLVISSGYPGVATRLNSNCSSRRVSDVSIADFMACTTNWRCAKRPM